MVNRFCPVCNATMTNGLQAWHAVCSECGYEMADFEPEINESLVHENIDEQSRERGLRTLRIDNFNKLLKEIVKERSSKGRLLDVGCAHGWFLEAAKRCGFEVLGIEPDLNIYESTLKRELPIRQGFFPNALSVNEKFDVIVFNDVFEHIPDIKAVLAGCKDHLSPNGMLVLNLPSSSGVFYNVARVLSKIGINSFFERLWQKDLPSPHLHYFNPKNLRELLKSNGFEEIATGRLSIVRLRGLFDRVSHTKDHSFITSLIISLVVALAIPFIWTMQSDSVYSISKRS